MNCSNIHDDIAWVMHHNNMLKNKNKFYEYDINDLLKNYKHSCHVIHNTNHMIANFLFNNQEIYIKYIPYTGNKISEQVFDHIINSVLEKKSLKDYMLHSHKVLICDSLFKDNKKCIKKYISDIISFYNIIKYLDNTFHITFNDFQFFPIHINLNNFSNNINNLLKHNKINMNNTVALYVDNLKNNIFSEKIIKKLLNIVINSVLLIDLKTQIKYIDFVFLRFKINYKKKIAKISIFSNNHALRLACKSSLISLKNIFDKCNIHLKSIIIEDNNVCKKRNFDYKSALVNQISCFSVIIKNSKNIKDNIL